MASSLIQALKKIIQTTLKDSCADGIAIFKSPLRWKTRQWMLLFAVVCGTLLLIPWDRTIQEFVQSHRVPFTDGLANGFELLGYGHTVIPAMLAVYGLGRWARSEKTCRFALQALESYILTGVFSWMFKMTTGRRRPFVREAGRFSGPFSLKNNSFPSGHTTTAIALAVLLASTCEHGAVTTLAYAAALGAGWARINDNKHWASDVFFGFFLGHYIARWMVKNKQPHPAPRDSAPSPDPLEERSPA